MKKILKWTGVVFGALIILTVLAGLVMVPIGMEKLTRSFTKIPVETVNLSTDPDAIARGTHIALIRGCTKCHGENLSGTMLADDAFLGTIPASNLTSGKGGIAGSYSDTDWVRALRHGIKPDGRVQVSMFDYSSLSDRDMGDLLAYLKQVPPVDAQYPVASPGPVLAISAVLGIDTPAAERIDHSAPRPADPVPGATKEYGKYLSTVCAACHGDFAAAKLEKWNREDFIRAFRTGVSPGGKKLGPTMSSKTFSELNDTELNALWLYFMDGKANIAAK